MMSEDWGFLKFLTGLLIVLFCLGGLAYWGDLMTLPTANQLRQKARESDPLVINTKQQNALRMLTQIQLKQEEIERIRSSGQDVSLAEASLKRMSHELREETGILKPDQVPLTVADFLQKN